MQCIRLEKQEYKSWDEFVESNYSGTIFHKAQWLENTDIEFEVYVIIENNQVIAGAVFSYNSIFCKKIYQQPVFTPYSGFVITDSILKLKNTTNYSKIKKIKKEIFKICTIECGKIFYSPYLDIDIHVEKWNGFNNSVSHTYVLSLNDINDVYNNFDGKRIKRLISKAKKDESTIIEESKDIEIIINLSKLSFQRQKMQLNTYNVLKKLYKNCDNKAFICFNKKNDKPIACSLIFYDSKRAYYLVGGYDYRNSNNYALTSCIWESIRTAFDLGLKEYDFEGTMLEKAEGQFRAFGGNLLPIVSVSKKLPVYYFNKVLREYFSIK
jgi:lipid II:glycine glycyltransferase (peptidoglycan interpeptide bridge formation enzyme)